MNCILYVGDLTRSSANAIIVPVSAAATHLANHSLGWEARCDLETALPKCGPRNPPAEEGAGYLGLAKVPREENKPGRKGDCSSHLHLKGRMNRLSKVLERL